MAGRRSPAGVTLHRFFVPLDAVAEGSVRFPPDQAGQIRSVLRLRPNDRVIVLDGRGQEYTVRLTATREEVTGTVEEQRPSTTEPRTRLTLYPGLLKGSKLELVLQKCTEIGVSCFVPIQTARAVPREVGTSKQRRYEAIVREAAEQSGRGIIPDVRETVPYTDALTGASAAGAIVVPWEGEHTAHLGDITLEAGSAVGLFIGPEGGFTEEEAEQARAAGAHIVTLGPRTLRAETAAIVASALVLSHVGDME